MRDDFDSPSAQVGSVRFERERLLELQPDPGIPLRLSPTDIAQYIRLEQCRRYLRLRLLERNAGQGFLRAWDAQPQSIPPLLTLSGREFEEGAEAAIRANSDSTHVFTCSREERDAQGVTNDNAFLISIAETLSPGGRAVVFQPLLQAEIEGWALTGVADAIDFRKDETGRLSALIVDFKSTTAARMEHRLQIAFYREMLDSVLGSAGIVPQTTLGVLYRGAPTAEAGADDPALAAQRADARETFGVEGYLERIDDANALRRHVRSLVLSETSEARRVLTQKFEELPFHLNYVCDGCLYNQFCLRQSAETDDLSLIPFLRAEQKRALLSAGVRRCVELAEVPLPAETWSEKYMQLAMAPALGAELDDLIVRARAYRESKGDRWPVQRWLPDGRQSSLPRCDADVHPNLIKIYIDVEHDYLEDRVYLLGALVVGAENGETSPERRRTVIELSDGPPRTPEQEAELLRRWIDGVIAAVVEVAAPDAEGKLAAPIHLIFYDDYDQRVLLTALGRQLGNVFGATALYDFASQIAAYNSPVITVLADEIKSQRNFPLLCQTLQSLARYLKFPWDSERPLTQLFRERYFDAAGKFEDHEVPEGDTSPWFTRRARFSSQLPLEYAYAAWQALPDPERDDRFAPFRAVTVDDLVALHTARLDAAERIAAEIKPNNWATKASFDLSNLTNFEDIATSFAVALDEFITIERHVALAAWKHDRAVSPERRVLSGASMLVRYLEEDQDPALAQYNRELYEFEMLTPEEKEGRLRPKRPEGTQRVRLRVDLTGVATSVKHAMELWGAAPGDRMVISPRWAVDSRLPVSERVPFTPTVRQLLFGASADIVEMGTDFDEDGTPFHWIDVELSSFGTKTTEFVFSQMYKGFEPGGLLTVDESPNDWYGSFQRAVVSGLREGKQNALFQRISVAGPERIERDPAAIEGQQRFLLGLTELREAGLLHGFEPSKERLIGGLAEAPTLLVQGPPGTGKSLTASYAILARVQGALAAGRPCRVIIACKTHAAVDELMRKLVEVLDKLAHIRATHTALWDTWFDERLLSLPIFRFEGREDPPAGVIVMNRKDTGDQRPDKRIEAAPHCVIATGLAGVYRMAKDRSTKKISLFDSRFCDLLVLDEASQINLPEAIMGALALKDDGQLIVIGDHRQMPPIVQNDWEREVRRTFVAFRSYESLFLTLRSQLPEEHQIRFEESFRVHRDIADFLRKEIYQQDKIAYFSRKTELLPVIPASDEFVAAVLHPEHPLTVVVHEEIASQNRNLFEQELMRPVLETLAANEFDPKTGLGVVVPHTAQRAALRAAIPALCETDPVTGQIVRSAVDTVERFQGAERVAIVVGATESDPLYLLANSKFLFDPRRLNVAISRAQRKLILVGSRSIFELFSTDEDVFASAQLWKNLLEETCTVPLWRGERAGQRVEVWGNSRDSAQG
jgi:hypothetical protein